MSQLTEEQIKTLFPSEDVQSAMVNLLIHKRPPGWGRKSNAPYYKQSHGLEMRIIADKMIVSREDHCFTYEKWCGTNGVSKETLTLKVNQAINYLLDKMDPDKKYYAWSESTVRRNVKYVGLMIYWKPEFRDKPIGAVLSPKPLESTPMPDWRRKVEHWLRSGTTEPFVLELTIILTPEDIAQLKKELKEAGKNACHIGPQSIKIIRMN